MPKEFIVAIELGSSKITGVAGKKNLDGSISILAVAQEDASACMRKGVVYNIDKTVICLNNIVKKLEGVLHVKVAKVFVGVGGRSIHSVKNDIVKDFSSDTIVTQDMVNELMDSNRNMTYPDQEILDAVTQEYKVDSQYQLDPVGIQCRHLEGSFLNILWRKSFYVNLDNCFSNAGITIAEMFLAPITLANSILTESEKRTGCVLVDMGAETTTVSVYYKNILRHIAVIPLGGANITKDLTDLHMDEAEAEKLKREHAKAYIPDGKIDKDMKLPIDSSREVPYSNFQELVEARVAEIVRNVWFQVPYEVEKLLGGIILTGGAANMPNMEEAFRHYTHIEKVRTANFITQTVHSTDAAINAHDGTMNTVLSLLQKGNENCAGEEITNDLFTVSKPAPAAPSQSEKPASPVGNGSGVVNKKPEEPEPKEEPKPVEEPEHKDSAFHKAWERLKKFGNAIVSDEEN